MGAVGRQDQAVGLTLCVWARHRPVQQTYDPLHGSRVPEGLWIQLAPFGGRKHRWLAHSPARVWGDKCRARVAVGVHEAQGDDPVEPDVGLLLGHMAPALLTSAPFADTRFQCSHSCGRLHPSGRRRRKNGGHARTDLSDEQGPGRGREGLELACVHHRDTCFPDSMASLRRWRSSST